MPRNLTLELVLDRLTSRLGASFGAVRRLYTLAGKRVNDVSELQDGNSTLYFVFMLCSLTAEQFYVASGNSSFRRVDYLHAGAKGASSAKISAVSKLLPALVCLLILTLFCRKKQRNLFPKANPPAAK